MADSVIRLLDLQTVQVEGALHPTVVVTPASGDVVMCSSPTHPGSYVCKRVLGLPNDHVVVPPSPQYRNGLTIKVRAAGAWHTSPRVLHYLTSYCPALYCTALCCSQLHCNVLYCTTSVKSQSEPIPGLGTHPHRVVVDVAGNIVSLKENTTGQAPSLAYIRLQP